MAKSKSIVADFIPTDIAEFLLESADFHEKSAFIQEDPISIPHRFNKKQDIEIIAFLVATIAWGNRRSIIRSGELLCELMDHSPYEFILQSKSQDFNSLLRFVHRTFNGNDLVYFCQFLQHHYQHFHSLESAFLGSYRTLIQLDENEKTSHLLDNPSPIPDLQIFEPMEYSLIAFREYFFSLPHPARSEKHVSSVLKQSACKRLNMFLRWMIRKNSAVDFGIWEQLKAKDLYLPLDVHVIRVANQLGLLHGNLANWQTCKDITALMRTILPEDPVKLDFALFGIGIEQKS